ncbi:MAG TPA: hypothetical protein VFY71_07370 [Planctomycetota bacterium]|nr:hypothetical protein [Planctomycetota bacterium]
MNSALLRIRSLVPAVRRLAAAGLVAAVLAPALSAQLPPCQPDLGMQGPGLSYLYVCGDLGTGGTFYIQVLNCTSFTPALIFAGLDNSPTPFKGGLLVPVPVVFSLPLVTDAAGEFLLGNIPGGGGPVTFYLQCASLDGGMPHGVSLSNAVQAQLEP